MRLPPSQRSATTTCCRACAASLLARLGRREEAHAELKRAAQLTHNARERRLLLDRAAACAWVGGDAGRVTR